MAYNKKEKMVVEDLRNVNGLDKGFKVKKLTNTIGYTVNQYLSARDVAEIITTNNNMTVDIVEKKVFSK
jgi:hypothetical protein